MGSIMIRVCYSSGAHIENPARYKPGKDPFLSEESILS